MRLSIWIAALAITFPLAAFAPEASAQDKRDSDNPTAGEQLDSAISGLMTTLRGLLSVVPQYEMPEMLDNGDIIIRKVPKEAKPKKKPDSSEPDTTRT